MDEERLSESAIFHLRWEVREGVADPDEVRRLLRMFCQQVENNEAVSHETLRHLADAFRSFLDSSKGIEAALGLKRKVGNPGASEQRQQMMALEVLRLRVEESTSLEVAAERVAAKFDLVSDTVVRTVWSRNKQAALALLRLERIALREEQGSGASLFTSEEDARIKKIFKKDTWFRPPKNSPNRPA